MAAPAPLLSVEDLSVEFRTREGLVKALDRDQRDLAERIRSGSSGRTVLKGAN